MIVYFLLCATSFLFIALRAFQQKNVQHNAYGWMMQTSYFMAACEVSIVSSIAHGGLVTLFAILAMGTGGGLGSIVATYLHNKWRMS